MRLLRPFLTGLPALALAACSTTEEPMGPEGPGPVQPPVIQDFSIADPDGIVTHGEFTTLRWSAPGAAEIAIVPTVGQGLNPQGGSVSIRPARATTYVIAVRNSAGAATDSVRVEVSYPPGIYVSASTGDDTAAGSDIDTPVRTLAEALSRTNGKPIFLAAGTYTDPLVIDGAQISVRGGLDPQTFFQGVPEDQYRSTVRPASGLPLSVHNTLGFLEIERIRFDALNTEAIAGEVVDAQARLLNCTFDARRSTLAPAGVPTALRVESTGLGAKVEARGCRIFGPRTVSAAEVRGVSVEDGPAGTAADLLLANCFVDSGAGGVRAAGVYVDSQGSVRLGMSTIGAETMSAGLDQDTPAAIRIVKGSPAIGGNILFTRGGGGGERFGVQEASAAANPLSLEGNLFISVGGTPYDNFGGPDPASVSELNDQPVYTIDPNVVVGDNLLVGTLSVSQIVVDVTQQDFHLRPVSFGVANPAVDAADTWVGKADYGSVADDIDGDNRPSFGNLWDLGADESN